MVERWRQAEQRGMRVALAFEQARGSDATDVSEGHSAVLRDWMVGLGLRVPRPPSADLLSRHVGGDRVIEVKSRGSSGPIKVKERQVDTFNAAASRSWLYVVTNTTQPQDVELWMVQGPAQLPWEVDTPATRTLDEIRGVRHEATLRVEFDDVRAAAVCADLSSLDLPTWAGSARD